MSTLLDWPILQVENVEWSNRAADGLASGMQLDLEKGITF